ncbi:MAG: hypothetical protein Q8R40_05050 [bacterium]|nr:hypothetical protein [bacterium]
MAEMTQQLSPEEEIRKLEQQLEQKKRELTQSGAAVPEEKEVFRQVLKEHIETFRLVAPSIPLTPHVPPPPSITPTLQDTQTSTQNREINEATVRLLIEKAMTGTIDDAVSEAQKISPYMVDELHDHLVDDMYDKLIALRKVKQL